MRAGADLLPKGHKLTNKRIVFLTRDIVLDRRTAQQAKTLRDNGAETVILKLDEDEKSVIVVRDNEVQRNSSGLPKHKLFSLAYVFYRQIRKRLGMHSLAMQLAKAAF